MTDRILSTPATSGNRKGLFSMPARYVWIRAEGREIRVGVGEDLHQPSPDELACVHQLPAVACILAALAGDEGAALADMAQERAALLTLRDRVAADGQKMVEREAALAILESEQRRKMADQDALLARREAEIARRGRAAEEREAEADRRVAAAEQARAEAVAERQGLLRVMQAAGQSVQS